MNARRILASILVFGASACFTQFGDYAPGCATDADCKTQGDVCLFETCTAGCKSDGQCPAGSRCLRTAAGTGCVTPDKSSCKSGCPSGTSCGADGVCRSACDTTVGLLCLDGQACVGAVCVGTDATHDSGGGPGGQGGAGGSPGVGGASGGSSGAGTGPGGTSGAAGGPQGGSPGGGAAGATAGAGGTAQGGGGGSFGCGSSTAVHPLDQAAVAECVKTDPAPSASTACKTCLTQKCGYSSSCNVTPFGECLNKNACAGSDSQCYCQCAVRCGYKTGNMQNITGCDAEAVWKCAATMCSSSCP